MLRTAVYKKRAANKNHDRPPHPRQTVRIDVVWMNMRQGLTEIEQHEFTSMLKERGWKEQDGVLLSPEQGLWFDQSHFGHWTLQQFRDIFSGRAHRIAKARIGDWQSSSDENRVVSEVAEALLNNGNTQQNTPAPGGAD